MVTEAQKVFEQVHASCFFFCKNAHSYTHDIQEEKQNTARTHRNKYNTATHKKIDIDFLCDEWIIYIILSTLQHYIDYQIPNRYKIAKTVELCCGNIFFWVGNQIFGKVKANRM